MDFNGERPRTPAMATINYDGIKKARNELMEAQERVARLCHLLCDEETIRGAIADGLYRALRDFLLTRLGHPKKKHAELLATWPADFISSKFDENGKGTETLQVVVERSNARLKQLNTDMEKERKNMTEKYEAFRQEEEILKVETKKSMQANQKDGQVELKAPQPDSQEMERLTALMKNTLNLSDVCNRYTEPKPGSQEMEKLTSLLNDTLNLSDVRNPHTQTKQT